MLKSSCADERTSSLGSVNETFFRSFELFILKSELYSLLQLFHLRIVFVELYSTELYSLQLSGEWAVFCCDWYKLCRIPDLEGDHGDEPYGFA